MRRPRPLSASLALACGVALAGAGCGSTMLSASQLRTQATLICDQAADRTDGIPTPAVPIQGIRFLRLGIAAIKPEVAGLRTLKVSGVYQDAVRATAGELADLRSALAGLRANNDPVIVVKSLQTRLAPLELRADSAWRSLGIPACQAARDSGQSREPRP